MDLIPGSSQPSHEKSAPARSAFLRTAHAGLVTFGNVNLSVSRMRRIAFVNIQSWLIGTAISLSLSLGAQPVDSLKRELAKEPPVEIKIELLKALGDAQLQTKPQEALAHFSELSRIAQQQQNNLLESYALNKIGNCWFYLNDLKQSTRFYFQALQESEEEPAYYDLKSRIYNNLGWSFKKLDDFEKALGYFGQAEHYARKTGDTNSLALILNNKGVTQKDLQQFDSALTSLQESLALNREIGNKRQERFNLNNISVIDVQLNRPREAIKILNQLLVLNQEMRDTVELVNNLQNLGAAYAALPDYHQAELSFLRALELANAKGNTEMKLNLFSELSSLFRKQGKLKEALDYFKDFYVLSDSLKTQETKHYALELETQYNSLTKEKELEKARTELTEQKLYRTWFVGVLIIVVAVAIFFWITLLLKRRNERKLVALYNEIEVKARELKLANEKILAINENLEKTIINRTETILEQNERLRRFAFMNAHKIRGPVASIVGIVNLLGDTRNADLSPELLRHLQTSAQNLDEVTREVNRQLEADGPAR